MTEEEINKEARKYAQPYFDEAFKHTTPSVSAICEHEGQYLINAFKEGARWALSNQWNTETKQVEDIVRDIKPECGLQPFDKVLVRDKGTKWGIELFSRYNDSWDCCYHFECLVNNYQECIPYNEETRYLFGTKKDAPEKYKTW